MTPGALLRLTVLGVGVLACQPSGAPPSSDSSLVAGAKIGNFMYRLGEHVADMDHRPKVDHPVGDPKARCQQ